MAKVNEAVPPPTQTTQRPPPQGAPSSGNPKRRWTSHLTDLPMLVIFAFLIAVLIKTFVVQAFFIPSGSMIPTLRVGDRVVVEKLTYHFRSPRVGDVVVFAQDLYGKQPSLPWYEDGRNFFRELVGLPSSSGVEDLIKRVVATGGDTIRYSGHPRKLIVNGKQIPQPYVRGGVDVSSPPLTSHECKRLKMQQAAAGCRVPDGDIFVMGDNRGNSRDSRFIGPIPESKVVGRAFTIIWPWSHFSGL